AKTYQSYLNLSQQFKDRLTTKYYIALVKGRVQLRRGSIIMNMVRDEKSRQKFTTTKDPTKGKYARTDFRVLKYYEGYTLLRIELYTGRTHQIRVHFNSIGHPVLGDILYNRTRGSEPMMLHALSLEFTHPVTKESMKCVAPLPTRFKEYIKSH
ncbi:MAG: RluA family pseudouridine synthase, partial [Spirochaetia bacterium]|nr:RluA family pseudouridine synthase [Spirochaetia bacterium]